jgi:hypothetical protein
LPFLATADFSKSIPDNLNHLDAINIMISLLCGAFGYAVGQKE